MEERASVPVSLPWEDPTTSYWQDPPSSFAHHRTTADLPPSAEVVVIGSGITGAVIAYHLIEQDPSQTIIMLEARTTCSGATGRNGGHTKCASYRSFLDNVHELGEAEAARIVRFEYACMRAVHDFALQHDIACDSWQGDTVDVIYDEEQWKLAKTAVARIQQVLGNDDPASRYSFWGTNDVAIKFLASGACGALSYEAGSLSAYKFVIGVLQMALNKGMNLQTTTPATSLKQRKDGTWVVCTPRGDLQANKVVLATNGYTAHIFPSFQGTIVPLRGHVTAHRPGSNMPRAGLGNTYSFIYEGGYEYMISRPPGTAFEGDIVIGGGLTKGREDGLYEYGTTHDDTVDADIMAYLHNSTGDYFQDNWGEDDPQGRVRKQWTVGVLQN
jgi:glycine/D-amino acid oxidase-like deaminating enzyme